MGREGRTYTGFGVAVAKSREDESATGEWSGKERTEQWSRVELIECSGEEQSRAK